MRKANLEISNSVDLTTTGRLREGGCEREGVRVRVSEELYSKFQPFDECA